MYEVFGLRAGRSIFRSFSRRPFQLNKPSDSHSIFKPLNVEEVAYSLRKDGLFLGMNLPQEVVREIYDFAIRTPCYANGETTLGFYYPDKEQAEAKYGKPFVAGSYYNTALLCPVIEKLGNDPILLAIARHYLKAEPIHQGNQLSWSFPVESTIYERRRETQMFHYDWDHCHFLKFFFYITDVDLCSSPHVCVRGSHVKKKLSHLLLRRGRSYQEITDYYGYKNLIPICGKAGFGFVEDTLCFRKGTPPGSKNRLLLEIKFATKDYGVQKDIRDSSLLECI